MKVPSSSNLPAGALALAVFPSSSLYTLVNNNGGGGGCLDSYDYCRRYTAFIGNKHSSIMAFRLRLLLYLKILFLTLILLLLLDYMNYVKCRKETGGKCRICRIWTPSIRFNAMFVVIFQ